MHFNGPQTKFICNSLYKHPVVYDDFGNKTFSKILKHDCDYILNMKNEKLQEIEELRSQVRGLNIGTNL